MRAHPCSPTITTLLALALTLLVSCDKKTPEAPARDDGRPAVRYLEVGVSPDMPPPPEWELSPDGMRQRASSALEESGALVVSDQADAAHRLRLTYGARLLEVPGSPKQLILGVSGKLTLPGESRDYSRIHAEPDPDALDAAARKAMLLEQFDAVVADVVDDLAVKRASPDEVLAMLDRRPFMGAQATGRALQRARQLVEQDATRRDAVIEDASAHVARDDPRAVTAAAGLLMRLDAERAGPLLVDAASRMARDGHFQAYVALLAMMGDLGGEEVVRYLETVSTGHPDAQLRAVASDALDRARKAEAK